MGMQAHTEYLWFNTGKEREMVHITPQVEAIVRASGVQDGLCFVSPMHITAAIYVNDHESGLIEDIGEWLEKLAPARPEYRHHRTGEDNADCCTMRQRCPSQMASSTWAPGSACSTQSLTDAGASASS